MSDVVVVGAGVIGLAVARSLADAGAVVTVLDAGEPGHGATGAAAGVLCPAAPAEWDGVVGRFNVAAAERWPAWAAELHEDAGAPCGVSRPGELRVGPAAEDGGPYVTAAAAGAEAVGWPAERLDAAGIAAREPALRADGLAGVWLPATQAVDTDVLTRALLEACRRRGVTVRAGARVTRIDPEARVVAVADGADRTVTATGRAGTGDADAATSGDLGPKPAVAVRYRQLVLATGLLPPGIDLPLRSPIRPFAGERLLVRADPAHPLCRAIVRTAGGPLVPRTDGTVWVGVTYADRGHQPLPTVGAVQAIADRATALLPALAHASLLDVRGGLRPVTDDGAPLIGPVADGVSVALGHGRAGILQAPSTADLVRAGVADGDWSGVPGAFGP